MKKQKRPDDSTKVHQPHDKLVKKLLENPEAARDILSIYLPKEVLDIADLSKLELQKNSYIDDEHRMHAVDLLYKTSFQGEEGYIWLLLEHQRNSDFWMPVRLFKYIALIWDDIRTNSKSKSIPLIYPIVIYNGDESWSHSLNLSDLIKPELVKPIFNGLFTNPFCLIDLPSIPDENLRKSAQTRVLGTALLMVLKHVFDKDLQSFFDHTLINIIRELDQTGGKDHVVSIVFYLLKEARFLDTRQFLDSLHGSVSPETEEKIMTIAQQLEKKGIEIGMQQGIHEGVKKTMMALKMLSNRDDLKSIASATGLTLEEVESLKKTINH